MSDARLLIGDVFERMAQLEDGSVDLVLTSPPFLALRSYLPADHPEKAKEIGSEPTPAAFVDTLLALTAEWRRILAPHGSVAVELGDTYSGSGGAGGDYAEGGMRDGQPKADGSQRRTRTNNLYNTSNRYSDEWNKGNTAGKPIEGVPLNGGPGWPMAKSLCLIPELYRVGLVYGVNPLTGQPSPAGQFRARNVVRWCRPNPPVGALGDKFRPATSEMVIACVSGSRYFDLDAVRTEAPRNDNTRVMSTQYQAPGQSERKTRAEDLNGRIYSNAGGAPPLDWWEIPTHGYPGSHYATWPPALCEKPIKAMVPSRVCLTCGIPSSRIVDVKRVAEKDDTQRKVKASEYRQNGHDHPPEIGWEMERTTVGWTDCGHDAWRNGIVLDPFAGSGTTLAVATGHGRDAIGIDLDSRNADLCRDRVGMFLSIDEPLFAAGGTE